MLEKLLIEDFQLHHYLLLHFDPYTNVLVGPTDCGKSSAIRALIWLMTNQPRGDSFIRHGCDRAAVTLWVDGHEIRREKGKKGNFYKLDGGSPFEAIGSSVPDEISRILNISPASLQRQLDPPFFFSLTAGEVSRELNAIVNLDLIDSTLSNLVSEHKKTKMVVQVAEDRLKQAKEKQKNLSWVIEAHNELLELEDLEKKVREEQKTIEDLQNLVMGLREVNAQMAKGGTSIMELEALVTIGGCVYETNRNVDGLRSLLDEIRLAKKRADAAQAKVDAIEEDLRERLDGKCPVCGLEGVDVI